MMVWVRHKAGMPPLDYASRKKHETEHGIFCDSGVQDYFMIDDDTYTKTLAFVT